MHENLGFLLIDLAQETVSSAVLAAPFVKSVVLDRILTALKPEVSLTVVTRWSPEEIVAGASDLGVWDLLQRRPDSKLRLLPGLHAKYFRFDDKVLLGSANLTSMALGWSKKPNLELLVEQNAEQHVSFEALILSRSFEVDQESHAAMHFAVDSLLEQSVPLSRISAGFQVADDAAWFPQSLQVQRLFDCYEGKRDRVISSVYEDGQSDLLALNPPPGLNEPDFNRFVAARMHEVPIVAVIDATATRAVDRASGAQLLIESGVAADEQSLELWDIISAWLAHFFPGRYRIKVTFTGPALERSQVLR